MRRLSPSQADGFRRAAPGRRARHLIHQVITAVVRQDIGRKEAALIVAAGGSTLDSRALLLPGAAISRGGVPDIGQIPGHRRNRIGGALVADSRARMGAPRIPDVVDAIDLDDAAGVASDDPLLVAESLNRRIAELGEPGVFRVSRL